MISSQMPVGRCVRSHARNEARLHCLAKEVNHNIRRRRIAKPESSLCLRLYESLTWNDGVKPADLIFVMAGRMERKQYGLELYRAGVAPRLVLSVGRFEVNKMSKLPLQSLDELIVLRDTTPPNQRHFFVKLYPSGIAVEKVRLPKWNTYGEALALRELVAKEKARRLIVVSTDVHLRRVRLTCRTLFRRTDVEVSYCAVPFHLAHIRKNNWWTRSHDRWFVLKEWIKLLGYRVILSTPVWVAHRLMRVKFHAR